MKLRFYISIAFALALLLNPIASFGQENPKIKKKHFKKEVKQGLKEAWKAIKKGEKYYEEGGVEYEKALDKYLEASKYNDQVPELNYKIGICYFVSDRPAEAIDYLKKAANQDEKVTRDVYFFLAKSLHENEQFEMAIEQYIKYKSTLSPKELKEEAEKIDKLIEQCKNSKELLANPLNVHIENMGGDINTSYTDYYPVLSRDEKRLYFSSRRKEGKKDDLTPYDNRYYEDIYYTSFVNGNWTGVEKMGKKINTKGNEVALDVSTDDKALYIYYGDKGGGDVYVSEFNKDKWRNPKKFKRVNTGAKESSLSISGDGSILFFVSDEEENSFGGKDIYYCKKKKQDKWEKPENIGAPVNSVYDEEGVFYDFRTATLYFSSKGPSSIGGYDIFKTTMKEEGVWSTPENLGYPINTPANEVFITFSSDGRTAYFSSDRKGGLGGFDLYKAIFMGPPKYMITKSEDNYVALYSVNLKDMFFSEEKLEIQADNVTILKGTVKDAGDSTAVYAEISIMDKEKNEEISSVYTDSVTGEFLVTLPAGKNYGISVSAKGYLFHSEYFDIPESAKYQEIEKEIFLTSIEVGSKIILKNIYFESGEATLRPESFVELGFVTEVLKNNPNIKIEIGGHTDDIGGYQANLKLSEERAKSVVNYLIGNGIEADRLEYKGYGFTEPIASNKTEEGRQENRRVEFTIIGK